MDEDIAMLSGYQDDDDLDALFGGGPFDDEIANVSPDEPDLPTEIPQDQDIGDMELGNFLQEGLDGAEGAEAAGFDLNTLNDIEIDPSGKDDNAVDYGDISDNDLAEEEESMGGPVQPMDTSFLSGIEESARDHDDLFGDDGDADMSFDEHRLVDGKSDIGNHRDDVESVASEHGGTAGLLEGLGARDEGMTEQEMRDWRLQQSLLQGGGLPLDDSLEDDDDRRLRELFPAYDEKDEAPFWNKLFPAKPGQWQGKEPKKPRPIRPTKVTLDIEVDQKDLFTTPAAVAAPFEPRNDLIYCIPERDREQLDMLEDLESDVELPNGLTDADLDFMCTDFDTLSHLAEEEGVAFYEPRIIGSDTDMLFEEDEFADSGRPLKKRRLGMDAHEIVTSHQFDLPLFDNPEKMTARLAREVVLDLNDFRLLVEEVDQEALRQRNRPGDSRLRAANHKDKLARRFRTSNDAAYNMLQQNQKKVRGQLTNMTIDHSVPAVRLQYPYYQVKLSQRELRNWHRKQILFKNGVAFSKLNKHKRKDFKTKSIRDAFGRTRDLSVADNSFALLLEYSEEHPVMLSQTGMGNKVVNYYRKLDHNDTTRPKGDIGDTSVLMPEDKSPFNNFGHVDPGESTAAIYNTMYRAPIFKQTQSPQDFLIVREVTGLNGQIHYLRNIDYQYVVGQELPTVNVPGTHSRMVTTVSKNRLRAISFRIARKKKSHRIRVEEVTRHFPDTNDMQNRQKMKEFMQFNKEQKEWEMRHDQPIPDEDEIQKDLTPEQICLLESMQVGAQYLHDSGYAEDDGVGDDDDDDKDVGKDLSIEQQLAPWKTTKNFIQATQGKAMLQLYGQGDPSGRGEAFSFIKTSMKGGFKAQGLSINENVQRGKGAGTGGHTYNVAAQQQQYDDSIREIWDRQKAVLSSQVEPENIDDEGVDGQLDNLARSTNMRATPASSFQTPSGRRRDDETGTSFSKRSTTSQAQKFLRIRRKVYNRDGEEEWKEVVESDPQVIKHYLKRKEQLELHGTNISDLLPTGDPLLDAKHKKRLEEELARLESNKKRRKNNKGKRDTQANGDGGSPNGNPDDPSTPAPVSGGRNTQATQRKCANCGQVGHIKTNKKLCPLLNGEIKQDTTGPMDSAAFMGAPPSIS